MRGQRTLRGFGLGAVAGGYAGGITATAFTAGVLVTEAAKDGSGNVLAVMGLVLVVVFVVGALIGAAVGAVAGLVLAGLGAERFAPPLASVLAVAVGAASITESGWGQWAVRAAFTSPLFAPVGWLTGRWFRRVLSAAGDPVPLTDRA